MGHSVATLSLRQATFLEKDRHNVIADNGQRYFVRVKVHLRTVLSVAVWNADEMRIRVPKKQQVPTVIISASTGPGLITVSESRDDSQLTLLTPTSALCDPIPPVFLSKNKGFEKNRLPEHQIYQRYDSTIRTSPMTFMNEVYSSTG
jgi:hypothetical protein